MTPLVVVETGRANLASVLAAFRRLGMTGTVTAAPETVRAADRVVLPGVGAFGDVMRRLEQSGVADALRERAESGRSLLAICLGLQLLASASDESPGVRGLGILPCTVQRLPRSARVPQLGWNRVESASGSIVHDGYAYYANSYCLTRSEEGWMPAWSTHEDRFLAAISRGPQLACQFHPELSGTWGADLLSRWLAC